MAIGHLDRAVRATGICVGLGALSMLQSALPLTNVLAAIWPNAGAGGGGLVNDHCPVGIWPQAAPVEPRVARRSYCLPFGTTE